MPALLLAAASLANAPWQPKTPPPLEAKALVDAQAGVATLAAPIEGMVFLALATVDVGSGAQEQLTAFDLCRTEPLGAACSKEQFAGEGRLDFGGNGALVVSPTTSTVTVPGFWLDRTEVAVGDYARCVESAECRRAAFDPGDPKHDRADLPVTLVGWEDAKKYCAWRGKRLPTEIEWERAARGPTGRRFPWGMLGNPRLANHGTLDSGSVFVPNDPKKYDCAGCFVVGVGDPSDGFAGLAPIGAFPAGRTPDGVVDLAGNAAEWVEDGWTFAHAAPGSGIAPSGSLHVVKGGSYRLPAVSSRGAAREGRPAAARDPDLGFRCARDPSSP
ncbi:MAG: SUMF1/EgtB/PvdO family nonheme iron enzyme [Polyangiales bacterium]